jgi:hypothetical protein
MYEKRKTYRERGQPTAVSPPFPLNLPGPMLVGAILLIALFAFELFNFDTTRFALRNLLGEVRFAGLRWATILAIAFCAIDFAGLVRFFMPHAGEDSREYWYLTGAWLLGATMNAIMTWWAVSLTLLNHDLGNEILSRSQLLEAAPIFIAALVWLTRILFIGALTVAGGYLFAETTAAERSGAGARRRAQRQRPRPARARREPSRDHGRSHPPIPPTQEVPAFLRTQAEPEDASLEPAPTRRVRRRPPAPARRAPTPLPMGAKGRDG